MTPRLASHPRQFKLGSPSRSPRVAPWLPPHAVSDAILGVASAGDGPPIANNLVLSRPVVWESLMKFISSALYQQNLPSELLPLVLLGHWSRVRS
ncbi:hypothetical protein BDN67DRAFT_127287 [Paxillus ammoniavirescens]|nr:hypothetical protein BDN67DRAFT_127287 [Paxillus ammoniavirescens]